MARLTANARGRSDREIASVLWRAFSRALAKTVIFCDDTKRAEEERRMEAKRIKGEKRLRRKIKIFTIVCYQFLLL